MAGLQRLGLVVKGLEQLVPLFGAATEEGQTVLKAINALAQFVQPGAVTPAAMQNQIQNMATSNAQNAGQLQMLKEQSQRAAQSPNSPQAAAA